MRLRSATRHPITRNVGALSVATAAGLLIPLLILPYLARTLGAPALGVVVFAQAFGYWLSVIGEFGFTLFAPRQVARVRDDREELAATVAAVLSATSLLLAVTAGLALLVTAVVPAFRDAPRLALLAWAFAATAGLNPRWYFQGVERLTAAAWISVGGQVVYGVLVLLLVHTPADGWKVLLAQAVAGALATGLLLRRMLRETGRRPLALRPGLAMLGRGRHLFVSHAATSLYTSANVFLLGLLAPPQQVAHFSTAERAIRAAAQVLSPISEAVYPRMSHLLRHGQLARARRLASITGAAQFALGATAGAALFLAAPVLVPWFLGPGFEPTAGLVRILALTLPLAGLANMLAHQWMLPLGRDRAYTRVILAAGVVNIAGVLAFAERYGPEAVAWSVVAGEVVFLAASAAVVRGSWRAARP